jgi:hypothetical protein
MVVENEKNKMSRVPEQDRMISYACACSGWVSCLDLPFIALSTKV